MLCRTYGARVPFANLSHRFRGGLTYAAPPVRPCPRQGLRVKRRWCGGLVKGTGLRHASILPQAGSQDELKPRPAEILEQRQNQRRPREQRHRQNQRQPQEQRHRRRRPPKKKKQAAATNSKTGSRARILQRRDRRCEFAASISKLRARVAKISRCYHAWLWAQRHRPREACQARDARLPETFAVPVIPSRREPSGFANSISTAK